MKSIKTVTTYACIKFYRFCAQQTTKDENSSRHEDFNTKPPKTLKVEN